MAGELIDLTAEEREIDEIYEGEANEPLPIRYSISSYGADYPVDSLVKRIKNGDIQIPDFQRGYVWPLPKASRFIESLLLGLPVPSIFLSKEIETNQLLVIDGQQRLRTLQYFYKGLIEETGRQFKLSGLASQYESATYESLPEHDRRHLDDCIIHAIIVRQDQPSDDESSIYHIFERLNTGGLLLAPQEIRACIYHGPFNDLLTSLNNNPAWREVFGQVNKRMRDQELILRFFALFYSSQSYEAPMKDFLNKFMGKNRHLTSPKGEELQALFVHTIDACHKSFGKRAFRPVTTINAAVYDAVMFGVGKRLDRKKSFDSASMNSEYEALLESNDFEEVTKVGTTQEANVKARLRLAEDAFRNVK